MKLSQLIEQAEKLKAQHGDIEYIVRHFDAQWTKDCSIEDIAKGYGASELVCPTSLQYNAFVGCAYSSFIGATLFSDGLYDNYDFEPEGKN